MCQCDQNYGNCSILVRGSTDYIQIFAEWLAHLYETDMGQGIDKICERTTGCDQTMCFSGLGALDK